MLSPAHRITSAADYRRTIRSGERIRGRHRSGHVQATPAGTSARFGFIVSKAVGMAHTRNLVRRRLKAITAEFLAEGLTGVDVVYRAHPSSANASYADLREDLRRGYSRIQQLSEANLEAAGQ